MRPRNVRLRLAYDGTEFAGWQRQAALPTIQGLIEAGLETMTRAPVTLHGAGRTDAGVHARGMVANFYTEARIPVEAFSRGLNAMLPLAIRVLESDEAPLAFHSRYDATGKTYAYYLFTGPVQSPLRRLYQAQTRGPFDLEAVCACLGLLIGTHDFSSFEGAGSRDLTSEGGRGAVRSLLAADCRADDEPGSWRFTFTGDGFLRHMVRNLVGTLILAAHNRLDPADCRAILAARDRAQAGPTAEARGLFLEEVHYTGLAVE